MLGRGTPKDGVFVQVALVDDTGWHDWHRPLFVLLEMAIKLL